MSKKMNYGELLRTKYSPEEIKAKVEKTWKALNKLGIYTEEQLDEAIKKQPPLNIGCMVSPIKKLTSEEEEAMLKRMR